MRKIFLCMGLVLSLLWAQLPLASAVVVHSLAGTLAAVSLAEDTQTGTTFEDVPEDSPFYSSVQWAVGQGLTNGTTNTLFSPYLPCTRKQILTFLWRADGRREYYGEFPFSDISPNNDFGKAALWAYHSGLELGRTTDNRFLSSFDPNTLCTRKDVVNYLWRLAGAPSVSEQSELPFQDMPASDSPETWAFNQSVMWAVENGITNGTSDFTFSPYSICTRGEVMLFLMRYQANIGA